MASLKNAPAVSALPAVRSPARAKGAKSPALLEKCRKQGQMEHARIFLKRMRAARKANPPTGERARNYGRGVSSVEMLLSNSELAEYYELLRKPTTTLAVAHKWVLARGHRIGFCAVHRHRMKFRERMAEQREAAEMSLMLTTVAKERGAGEATDASAAYVEQQMLLSLGYALRATKKGEPFDPRLWLETNKAIGEAIKNRGNIEKLRKFLKDFETKKPLDGWALCAKMRTHLGLPPPPPRPRVIAGRWNPDAEAVEEVSTGAADAE